MQFIIKKEKAELAERYGNNLLKGLVEQAINANVGGLHQLKVCSLKPKTALEGGRFLATFGIVAAAQIEDILFAAKAPVNITKGSVLTAAVAAEGGF